MSKGSMLIKSILMKPMNSLFTLMQSSSLETYKLLLYNFIKFEKVFIYLVIYWTNQLVFNFWNNNINTSFPFPFTLWSLSHIPLLVLFQIHGFSVQQRLTTLSTCSVTAVLNTLVILRIKPVMYISICSHKAYLCMRIWKF